MNTIGKPPPGVKPEERLTFARLAAMEPALASLEAEVLAVRRAADTADRLNAQLGRKPKPRCANAIWYHRIKDKVVALVGWGRTARLPDAEAERVLRSVEAYDLVYDRLYLMLPDCRGCCCLPVGFASAGKGVRS